MPDEYEEIEMPDNSPPPQILAALLEQQDRAYMKRETLVHDVQRLFTELPPDHLLTLKVILNSIAAHGEMAAATASYFEGQAAAVLYAVHNKCSGCGQDHSQEILEKLE